MTSNEGTAKTTPHPEGSLGDKDSKGNIPPADMELIHTPVVDPLGTGAKYQVDETQSTRLRMNQKMKVMKRKCLLLGTTCMSPDLKKFDNTLSLTERQLIKYLRKMSRVLFNRITEKQWELNEEASVSYADLKASIDQYYDENMLIGDMTDRGLVGSLNEFALDKSKYNTISESLQRISSNITEVLSLVKGFDFSALLSNVKDLQAHALKQKEVSAAWTKSSTNMAWNLGSRMTIIEIFRMLLKVKSPLFGRTLQR
ncbi:hypothetical protein Tco_0636908 [Tanacetum coccineum]